MGVNRRAEVRMDDAEVHAFLSEQRTLSMGSFAPDGSIHLVAMWYGFVGELVAVETKARSQKVRNLTRDPRITVLVESGTTYETLRGVELVGRAEIVEPPAPRMFECCASILTRYVSDSLPPDHVRGAVERMMYKRVGIIVHPERVVSWDHSRLSETRP
jgi:PPOX class probable F420-dependent enzyme